MHCFCFRANCFHPHILNLLFLLYNSCVSFDDFRMVFTRTQRTITYETYLLQLKDHFRIAGNVVFASISVNPDGTSKECGVVQFETVSEAQNAISIMRNHPMESSVEPLYVREDYQEERTSSQPHASGRMGGGSGLLKSDRMNKKWRCANDENASVMDDGTTEKVLAIIRARDAARKRRNYEASDAMRDELKTKYNVNLDDRLYLWWNHVEGGSVSSNLVDIKGEGSWDAPKSWRQIPTTPENDLCVDANLVNALLTQRDIARREKDFATADRLLEQARNAPDGDLYLRIHDESRTWRIWTDEPPPRVVSNRQRADSVAKGQAKENSQAKNSEMNVIDECLALVSANDPEKVEEIRELLNKFPGRQYNILSKLKQRYDIL